ncbi:hypothetical protein CUMW_204890 [Citrus unshiu]|uniref:Uncharacterized protein n=1 Tax=Citrus unshiu TaxID=55188 RepID=A0A2H5Q841_CITUN|nr:hypothetical protein CUMW_204890 [Citrus unshiu]
MSNLFSISFHNWDSRSVGAFAGLDLVIVFTWRIVRSPGAPQRRQPKRHAPSTSNSVASTQANATLMPSGASSSSEDLRTQIADALFQPPTLGQVVSQKLSEGRKVTCRLLGVILEESSPEEILNQVTVSFVISYLMERVLDDESVIFEPPVTSLAVVKGSSGSGKCGGSHFRRFGKRQVYS